MWVDHAIKARQATAKTGSDARALNDLDMFKKCGKKTDCWGSEWPGVLLFLKGIWTETQIRHCTDGCKLDGSTLQREQYWIVNGVNK